jgi:hypothetical protein
VCVTIRHTIATIVGQFTQRQGNVSLVIRSLLIISRESVLDRLYRAVIYTTLRFVQVVAVRLIITVENIYSGAAS